MNVHPAEAEDEAVEVAAVKDVVVLEVAEAVEVHPSKGHPVMRNFTISRRNTFSKFLYTSWISKEILELLSQEYFHEYNISFVF